MVSRPARLAAASILILFALVAACTIIFMPRSGDTGPLKPAPSRDDLRLDQVAPAKAPEAALAIAAVAVPLRGEVMVRAGVQVAAPCPHSKEIAIGASTFSMPPRSPSQVGVLASSDAGA